MVGIRWRPGKGGGKSGAVWGFTIGAMVFAACGGSVDDIAAIAEAGVTSTTPQSEASSDSSDGIEDQTFVVGEHFWHSGFRVDIVDGAIESTEDFAGEVTRVLTLAATLENNATDTGYFGASVAVATSSNSYSSGFNTGLPDVPGGLKAQATFEFRIDEDFDLASAELIIGDPDENQARIPLSGAGDAVRLEPRQLDVAGLLSMELIDLSFTSASLQYDVTERHRQVEKGSQALTINFDATSRNSGNWQIFATDLVLIFSDGTGIVADAAEIGSLPGTDEGVTTSNLWVRFLVDESVTGDLALRLTPGSWFVGDDDVTEATFDFTIE